MDKLTDTFGSDDLVMLVKVGHSALKAKDSNELYELSRKWWRASPLQARRVQRVLAVADNRVVAAYVPQWWEVSSAAETLGRIAFHGTPAAASDDLVGLEVAHLYPKGASNPVRYAPRAAVVAASPGSRDVADTATGQQQLLLLRINQSWHPGLTPEELFEVTHGYWVMSPVKAESVTRVLAVAHGIVREVYEPLSWSPSPVRGEEHRIGFDGPVSEDRDLWLGSDVSTVFPHGSQNPVRYVRADELASLSPHDETETVADGDLGVHERGAAPDLAELINPLLEAFDHDLLWSMSRAAQELFHSNTMSWLMWQHPVPAVPLRTLFEGPDPVKRLEVWREWRHIDVVAQRSDGRPRFVIENKLYSIPYPEQLEKYAGVELPWSKAHGPLGAPDTSYFLLSLMEPTFPLPQPWRLIAYGEVLTALDSCTTDSFGSDADLFDRYRGLVRRLVELKDAVDPRQDLDAPFSVKAALGDQHLTTFSGPVQRMRYTALAQTVSEEYGEQLPLVVDLSNSTGMVSYFREISDTRTVGWQLQGEQLRMFVLVRDRDLVGQGDEKAAARARIAQAEYADFVNFDSVEAILGARLLPSNLGDAEWRRFAPDFVYRYRKVHVQTTTRELAVALADLTAQVGAWASAQTRT